MKIQSITICKPKPSFTKDDRHKYTDRAVTVEDLYDMEDRINAKINRQNKKINEIGNDINQSNYNLVKDQNKILGQALSDMAKLIYFRPLANSHECYKTAQKSSEMVKNNEII